MWHLVPFCWLVMPIIFICRPCFSFDIWCSNQMLICVYPKFLLGLVISYQYEACKICFHGSGNCHYCPLYQCASMVRCMYFSKYFVMCWLFCFFSCFNNFKLALTFVEKGEVISEHYKLLPVDLRDIPKLDDIISLANIDPRYAREVLTDIVCFFLDDDTGLLHSH